MSGPVTLGSMRARGESISVRCMDCKETRILAAADIPKPDNFPFPKLEPLMRCAKCGVRNGERPGHHSIEVAMGVAEGPLPDPTAWD